MATLQDSPGGSAIDLGHIQVSRVTKNTGITPIPEILGDSDEMEAIKTLSSMRTFDVQGIKTGTTATINTFKSNLETWSINGDGTTSTTVDPTPIDFIDDDGIIHKVVVMSVDYVRYAGRVSVLEYTLKLMQKKTS